MFLLAIPMSHVSISSQQLLSQHINKLPVHGAFLTANVSGLHLSGHGGLPKYQSPAHSK